MYDRAERPGRDARRCLYDSVERVSSFYRFLFSLLSVLILRRGLHRYTDNAITEAEFNELPPREQDRVQRVALKREAGRSANGFMGQWDAASTVALSRCKRIDWLHGRVFFDGLERDDEFAKKRLGYSAPNVFKLTLSD